MSRLTTTIKNICDDKGEGGFRDMVTTKQSCQVWLIGSIANAFGGSLVYGATGNYNSTMLSIVVITSGVILVNYLVGKWEDRSYSPKSLRSPREITPEPEKSRKEPVKKSEPTFVKKEVVSSWVKKANNLKVALYEYHYGGDDPIAVEIVHYSDDAPMVEEFQIIPITRDAFERSDLYTYLNVEDENERFARHNKVVRKGANLSKIATLGDNLSRDLGLAKGLKVSIDLNIGDGKAAIYVPKENREWVYTKDYLEEIERSDAILPMFLGKGLSKNTLIIDQIDAPHTIIGGTTKSGKTVSVVSQLLGLAYARSPDHVQFTLIDPKIVGLSPISKLPHCIGGKSITDMEQAMFVLEKVVGEMYDRNEKLESAGVQDIQEYNNLNPDDTLPYKMIVCDEFLMAMGDDSDVFDEEGKPIPRMTVGKAITKSFSKICIMGRSVGFHFIPLTQRFAAEDIPGTIRDNITMGVCLSVPTANASKMIIQQSGGESLLKYGDSLVNIDGWDYPLRVQGGGFENGSEEIRDIVEMIKQKWQSSLEEKEGEDLIELSSLGFGG